MDSDTIFRLMNSLFFLLSLILITGCQQQEKPRQYTEVAPQVSQAQTTPVVEQKPPDIPHAGIDMASNITPDASANLQQMLAEGQDPHAGIDMSVFAGNNPHAGLNMPAMMGNGTEPPNPYSWTLPKGWKQGANRMMRLASFYLEADPDAIDCYIVALPGMAGGMEANLKRWMGQADIDPSDANYKQLLNTARTLKTKEGLEATLYDLAPLQQRPSGKTMIVAVVPTNDTTIFVKMTGTKEHVKQNRDSFLEFLKSLVAK